MELIFHKDEIVEALLSYYQDQLVSLVGSAMVLELSIKAIPSDAIRIHVEPSGEGERDET